MLAASFWLEVSAPFLATRRSMAGDEFAEMIDTAPLHVWAARATGSSCRRA